MRRYLIGLFLLLCAGASLAQADNAFPSFLLRLREIGMVDIHAFGDTIIAPNLADAAFEPYLSPISPQLSGRRDCAWQGGGYMKKGDVVCVFLQAHLLDYHDEHSDWFAEPLLTKYMVATYTKDGKLLDGQCLGNGNGMYRFSIDEARGDSFCVSQLVLDDPAMAHDYDGLDYTVQRSEVTISPKGEIRTRRLNEYRRHVPDEELCSNPPLAFEDFLKKFRRCDKSEPGDSLFVYSQGSGSFLASSLLLNVFPKEKICGGCWPKDLVWTPCGYIETRRSFLCCMVMECEFPRGNGRAYVDYVAALFDKGGHFQKIVNVMHRERDDVDTKMDTEALKEFLRRQVP